MERALNLFSSLITVLGFVFALLGLSENFKLFDQFELPVLFVSEKLFPNILAIMLAGICFGYAFAWLAKICELSFRRLSIIIAVPVIGIISGYQSALFVEFFSLNQYQIDSQANQVSELTGARIAQLPYLYLFGLGFALFFEQFFMFWHYSKEFRPRNPTSIFPTFAPRTVFVSTIFFLVGAALSYFDGKLYTMDLIALEWIMYPFLSLAVVIYLLSRAMFWVMHQDKSIRAAARYVRNHESEVVDDDMHP